MIKRIILSFVLIGASPLIANSAQATSPPYQLTGAAPAPHPVSWAATVAGPKRSDLQQALDMPRFLSGRFGLLEPRDTLHIEARFPAETIAELARRSHLLDRWGDWDETAGHANGITIDALTGERLGGADPRSDGEAVPSS